MTATQRAAAITTAIISATFLSATAIPLRADSTWIDPTDPTGLGTDPSPGTHLSGSYTDVNHWSPSAVPGSTANLNFAAPGYPSTSYTVSLSANQTASKATIANPVTFSLSNRTFTLNSTINTFNDVSLLVANQKLLTVKGGALKTQGVQLGSNTSASTGPALLVVDGNTSSLQIAGNIANYQTLTAINAATIRLGNNVVLDQAPDLSLGGYNTGLTLLDTQGSIHFANNVTIRGGTMRATNGAQIVIAGTSLTFDSLYFDYDLGVGGEDFTMNIASTLLDPHNGSAVIPTTITGALFVDGSTFNVSHALLRLTADAGATWNPAGTAGNAHLNIANSTVNTGTILFDGDSAPGAGSHTIIDSSSLALHGDMIVGDTGHSDILVTGTSSSILIDGTLYVDDGDGGAGTVTIGAGNSLSAATAASIGGSGILNMQGGTFTTPAIALAGTLKGHGNVFGAISGTGTVQADSPNALTTDSLRVNSLIVSANASHVLRTNSAYSKINSLSIAHTSAGSGAVYTGVLQLNNNRFILQTANSTSKASAILAINEALFAGHNGTTNTWTGNGITSSTVAADPSHLTIGIYDNAALHSLTNPSQPRTDWAGGTNNVDPNSILITPALKGDANLDGIIDIADMVVIANNWNQTSPFNLTSALAAEFPNADINAGTPSAAAVPEPGSLLLLSIATALVWRKRKIACR